MAAHAATGVGAGAGAVVRRRPCGRLAALRPRQPAPHVCQVCALLPCVLRCGRLQVPLSGRVLSGLGDTQVLEEGPVGAQEDAAPAHLQAVQGGRQAACWGAGCVY